MPTRLTAQHRGDGPAAARAGRRLPAVLVAATVVMGGITAVPAASADAAAGTATLTGGAGTITVGGKLYAKQGAALTITIVSEDPTKCVFGVPAEFTGARDSAVARTTWTFTGSAGAGDAVNTMMVGAATGNSGGNDRCNGQSFSRSVSYTSDNTGPVVTGTPAPAANAAGWSKTNTTVTWSATDAGSGVASGPTPASALVDVEGTTNLSSTATDRLGNVGTGSAQVRLDKTAPTITATQSSAGWGEPTTVTFVCNDALSGIASCRADGTITDHVEVTDNGTVTGTAVDNAGNTKTLSVEVRNVDTTPPTLTGAPTTQPNTHGWYDGPVTIRWTAADPQSGIADDPADTTISGEGADQTSTTTVANGAGLTATATSSPPVSIDTTAPTTSVGGVSNAWVNGAVTLSLAASDNLAGVDFTSYSVDGGPVQRGTSLALDAEGVHTIEYFSTDKAGNVEAAKTTEVRIDKTLPTISHRFDPDGYLDGAWTNQDVTVTFLCADGGGSGVLECTDPITKTAEGGSQQVVGTVKDGAGNTATDTATVSIDKTDPTITAAVDREPNGAGWYDDDVTVSFTATDDLSGIAGASAPQVLREGADQSASGTATDAAGNTAGDSVSGINVDKTAPALVGEFGAGWHTGNVTVSWTCTDGLSGVATAPDDTVVSGEGENLSATATCTDKAGNTVSTTVPGIDIDRRAPHTTASVRDPLASGWYGAPVEVTLTGEDTLSGVASTFYTIDGGEKRTYGGPFDLDDEGTHTITFWSVDRAGNVEDAGEPIELKIDTSAPVTTVTNPIVGNPDWWVTSGIPFSFDPQDGTDRSGIAATYFTVDGTRYDYAAPVSIDLSTGVHQVSFWSVDRAGNIEEKQSFEVKVDTTPPTIAGEAFPEPNEFGWNNTDVEVKFTCQDVGSGVETGVAGCAGDTVLSNDGAGQGVRGDAVDVAGNKASTEVTGINIDKTKPTLVGVPSDSIAVGWHKGDVTVKWVGDDALSGINDATKPADSTITGEGRDLTAGPRTIEDQAGNVSEPAMVTGIKIDRSAPVIQGAPKAEANAAGWHNGEVVVDFTCTDPDLADGSAGSGVAACPTSKLIKGNGAGQSVTSDPAMDLAGNRTPGTTVGGINIDGSAPSSTANNTCTAVNEWCKGETADVVVTAADQTGLSGVKEIHYVVDGGDEEVVAGSSATVSVPLSGSGAGTVRYWAVDRAGNAETPNSVALKWDNIAPTVTHSLSPAPNATEWNNTDVTVTFTAKDDDKGSGVASVTAPVKIAEETAGREILGTASDKVGNVGTDKVTVRLDKTAPTITGAITNGTKGNNDWYVGPVTVTFTCNDVLSGVATCPDPVVLTANGPNTATGTVTDKAGNTATTSVGGIRIDQEKPTLTSADVNVQGGTFTLGAVPGATCTATDSFSGVESCTVVVVPTASGVGTFTYTATATDKAGNTNKVDGSFRVVYKWGGFLQPINDTAHQVDASTSIFKAGSTVPVKFELRNSSGVLVQAASAPSWLTPVKGSAMSVPVDESVYGLAADSGSDYRLDGKQYQYNWKTPSTGGSYYRIGVLLDDGQKYFVNIGLR